MENVLKALEQLVQLIMEHPLRTAMIIFFSVIFMAMSTVAIGVWQMVVVAFWFLATALIMFVPWEEMK